MEYSAKIVIGLRPSVLDPAGTAVESSLHQLGYEDVQQVRIGKHVTLTLQADSEAE
ncbi:MAG: phosphoribosylformylglycinamidine synthase subunit PurS, partial [Cyanobacteria bacterium J06639_1]